MLLYRFPMLRTGILFLAMTILGTFVVSQASANVVGEDDRFYVSEVYQALDLDLVEMLRIRQTTGFVHCSGRKHGNPITASAYLVHRNDVIVTNAHTFIDERGRAREPLAECYFQTQGIVPEKIAISTIQGAVKVSRDWRANLNVNDYGVARLVRESVHGRAFPIAPADVFIEGHSFILVSAMQVRKKNSFNGLEPIAQRCLIRKNFSASLTHGSVFYGDCDISSGASGSAGLIRFNGRLHAFSVASGGGFSIADGREYSFEGGSYSFHSYIADGLLQAILQVSDSLRDDVLAKN